MSRLKWDREFALEQAADDVELLQELLCLFKDSFRSNFTRIKEGLENSDPREICTAAHSLRGASASLGLNGITEVAMVIEEDSHAGNLAAAQSNLLLLQTLLDELLEFI